MVVPNHDIVVNTGEVSLNQVLSGISLKILGDVLEDAQRVLLQQPGLSRRFIVPILGPLAHQSGLNPIGSLDLYLRRGVLEVPYVKGFADVVNEILNQLVDVIGRIRACDAVNVVQGGEGTLRLQARVYKCCVFRYENTLAPIIANTSHDICRKLMIEYGSRNIAAELSNNKFF